MSGDGSTAVADRLLGAVRGQDWAQASTIIDEAWIELTMTGHLDAVGQVVATLPEQFLHEPPTAGLVAENVGRLPPGSVNAQVPADHGTLRALGRSPAAHRVLSRTLAGMAARRRRGLHTSAMEYVARGTVVADAAEFVMFREVRRLLPFWQLQAGITAHLAGELGIARRLHRAAYRSREASAYDIVGRDAAGNMAMIEALSGRLVEADAWLTRALAETHGPTWVGPLVQVPIDVAAGIAAADRLDREGCLRFLERAATSADHDEHWAGVLFAYTSIELVLGDIAGAVAFVAQLEESHERWTGETGLGRTGLALARADLALTQGRGTVARSALRGLEDDPAAVPTLARLALLEGDPDRTAALADAAGHDETVSLRGRLELLLVGAAADVARDQPEPAAERLATAVRLAEPHGILRVFATVPRAVLEAVEPRVPGLRDVLARLEERRIGEIYPDHVVSVQLTRRERELLHELAGPLTLGQIAEKWFVSRETVKSQMNSLRTKLEVSTRQEVLSRAAALGLTGAPEDAGT